MDSQKSHFPYRLIDLSHPLDSNVPSWTGDCGFSHYLKCDYQDCETEVKFKVQTLSLHAGIGTHMDAPAHCFPSGKTIVQIPLEQLCVPCIMIDIAQKADEKYRCSKEDILEFEQEWGEIESGSFVIVRTGWEQYWTEPERYRNNLQFPSVSHDAASLLLERGIVGLGVDALSPDTAASGYPVHELILGAGLYLIENIANAGALPAKGSYILALPLPIVDGTEAPMRLIGLRLHP